MFWQQIIIHYQVWLQEYRSGTFDKGISGLRSQALCAKIWHRQLDTKFLEVTCILLSLFNCKWVDTWWQQYSTQNTVDRTHKQYTEYSGWNTQTVHRLTPGGSSTVHIYTQTVHRIQWTEHTNSTQNTVDGTHKQYTG
jgi:hypothetical protein